MTKARSFVVGTPGPVEFPRDTSTYYSRSQDAAFPFYLWSYVMNLKPFFVLCISAGLICMSPAQAEIKELLMISPPAKKSLSEVLPLLADYLSQEGRRHHTNTTRYPKEL